MVNAVAPFGEVVSFEKEYQRTSAYYAFEEPLRALFSTKVFYSTLTDLLPLNARIPCLDPDAFINEHIAMQFFSRIMHVDANVDAICAELRRCFDISSIDELVELRVELSLVAIFWPDIIIF